MAPILQQWCVRAILHPLQRPQDASQDIKFYMNLTGQCCMSNESTFIDVSAYSSRLIMHDPEELSPRVGRNVDEGVLFVHNALYNKIRL